MLFTSYGFVLFLLILFLVYYLIPGRFQWMLLLVFSYVYYGLADVRYLIFIGVTTLTTYGAGVLIDNAATKNEEYLKLNKETISRDEKKALKAAVKKKKYRILLVCMLLNFGILAVMKYTNFTIVNINSLLGFFGSAKRLNRVDWLLPLGISFYTFQSMGYIIDVYRGTVKAERNVGKFALFVSFFPQLIQGPISRFSDLAKTLYEKHPVDTKTISFGLQRMLWGYFKKVVIADRMLVAVTVLIGSPEEYKGAYAFFGALFYAFELYCDFTGGIDITIGIAQVLGVKVTENFNRPYFSKCIKEYWNRWHITMGSWFTDYIFYPISVCKPMLKLAKFSRKNFGEVVGKRVPVYLSCFVVWFATGIWHGAAWNFIVWGLMNCLVILVSQEFEPLYRKFHEKFPKLKGTFGWKSFQIIRTVLLMSSLRMFDCYRDVPLTFRMFGTIFTVHNWGSFFNGGYKGLGLDTWDWAILFAGLIICFTVSMIGRSGSVREKIAAKPLVVRLAVWYILFAIILVFGHYGLGYDASQFIYNQF